MPIVPIKVKTKNLAHNTRFSIDIVSTILIFESRFIKTHWLLFYTAFSVETFSVDCLKRCNSPYLKIRRKDYPPE